jgi:hypothetical protein
MPQPITLLYYKCNALAVNSLKYGIAFLSSSFNIFYACKYHFNRPCTCHCWGSWFAAAGWDNQELCIDRQLGFGPHSSGLWPHRWVVGSSHSPQFATVPHCGSWSLGHTVGFNEPLSGVEQGCRGMFTEQTFSWRWLPLFFSNTLSVQ